MPTTKATVYTVTISSGIYRFSDLVDHGTHYTARLVLDDNRLGRMIRRVSKADIAQATVTQEELTTV